MTENNFRAGAVPNDQSAIFIACAHRLDEVGSQYLAEELRSVQRELLAASPVEQPAAEPIDDARECLMDLVSHRGDFQNACNCAYNEACSENDREYWEKQSDVLERMKAQAERALASMTQPAPSPADERAAFEVEILTGPCANVCYTQDEIPREQREQVIVIRKADYDRFIAARAASASETVAEPTACKGKNCGSLDPRFHSAECFEEYEKTVGLKPAMAAEAVAIPAGYALVPMKITDAMIESAMEHHYGKRRVRQHGGAAGIAMTVNEHDWSGVDAMRRFWKGALAAAPQPAHADAREGLTNGTRAALFECAETYRSNGWPTIADEIDALIQGANHAE